VVRGLVALVPGRAPFMAVVSRLVPGLAVPVAERAALPVPGRTKPVRGLPLPVMGRIAGEFVIPCKSHGKRE